MVSSSFRKTAMVAAVTGAFAAALAPAAQADVLNFSWTGAFTIINPTGTPVLNAGSDYASGYYADGSGGSGSFGAPTTHGWGCSDSLVSRDDDGPVIKRNLRRRAVDAMRLQCVRFRC